MRTLLVASLLLALTGVAHAQRSGGGGQIGFEVSPMPSGSIDGEFLGIATHESTEFAVGIGGYIEARLAPMVTLGFAPRYIFNVKAKNSNDDAATELDLHARLGLWIPINPNLQLYGLVEPGYSIVFVPNQPSGVDNPAGLVLDFGGGLLLGVGARAFLAVGIGYQFGFQGGSYSNVNYDLRVSYFHIDIGVGTRF